MVNNYKRTATQNSFVVLVVLVVPLNSLVGGTYKYTNGRRRLKQINSEIREDRQPRKY